MRRLALFCVVFGALLFPGAASAHQGDWSTQWNVSRSHTHDVCHNYVASANKCYGTYYWLDAHWAVDAHSRVFRWKWYGNQSGRLCTAWIYIDHNYTVWGREYNC